MLHVTTEVGVPGKTEREKRHFPELTNVKSTQKFKPHGRRYIPHGYGDDVEFRPHPQGLVPKYSEEGPDWKSRIRPIPSPHPEDYPAEENWPQPWKPLRTFPGSNNRTIKEWALYAEGPGFDSTLRSKWDGIHKASNTSQNEVTHTMRFGKGRIVIDKRNSLPNASPGDKSYQAVEYSPQFHKFGSTLPVVNFGGNARRKADTFVPLVELPAIPRESYVSKERQRKLMHEIGDVLSLESWRPASPLTIPPSNIHGQPSYAAQMAALNESDKHAISTK